MIRKGLTQEAAETLLAIREKLGVDAPERGAHIGPGRHVSMPDTWDGAGRVPPGWSGTHGLFEEEEQVEEMVDDGEGGQYKQVSTRKLGTFSVGLAGDTAARLARDAERLTPAERLTLSAELKKGET